MLGILFAAGYRNELSEFTGLAGRSIDERNANAAPIAQIDKAEASY